MQTRIDAQFRERPGAAEAEAILRACVHCGFCNATCPTYLALGDERDGPRGRIYLIKELLAGADVTERTQGHLDRCLTCRSCETTCPSGVRYGRLADFARPIIEERVGRSLGARVLRWLLKHVVTRPVLFTSLLRAAQLMRGLAPPSLRERIPTRQPAAAAPVGSHARTMIALAGCAQAAATPRTHAATVRVLDRLGIALATAPGAGCCGALSYHLGDHAHGKAFMRRNIDAWWPAIERGAEAIVVTASGCGATIKEYGEILADDPDYAHKAATVAALTRDIVEVLGVEDLSPLSRAASSATRTAVHCPCTLSHAQRLGGRVEAVLERLGFELSAVRDGHLCCGSAGTYSILQPSLSRRLRDDKIAALTTDAPDQIATANVGCQLHLAQATSLPVRHWIELLDDR